VQGLAIEAHQVIRTEARRTAASVFDEEEAQLQVGPVSGEGPAGGECGLDFAGSQHDDHDANAR
jgi:hypothetical protein